MSRKIKVKDIKDREVRKLADSLGVQSISHRRPISKQTMISDLKNLARRLGIKSIPKRKQPQGQ